MDKNTSLFRISLCILSFCIALGLNGCYVSYYETIPLEDNDIQLYNMYNLKIYFRELGTAGIIPRYIQEVKTATPDTLPVLIIDSCCFELSCLSSIVCKPAITGYEQDLKEWRKVGSREMLFPVKPKYKDLYYYKSDSTVRPMDYRIEFDTTLNITDGCENKTVIIYSRLLDRKSGQEIDSDIRTIELKEKHVRTWGPGNM